MVAVLSLGFVIVAHDASADDPPVPNAVAPLALTELGVTLSTPPPVGFVHRVEAGRDVVVARPPYDALTISFAMITGRRGEPCALAEGLDGKIDPLALPPGWQRGARFRTAGIDTSVFCVDVAAGQLNVMTVRASSESPDEHLKYPYGTLFVELRAEFGDAIAPQPVAPVVVPAVEPPKPSVVLNEPTPPAPPSAEVKPPPRPMLGYRAYAGSFYDIGYGREMAPWASPDGKTAVALGGLRMFENKGLTVNIVMMVLSLGAAASKPLTRVTTDSSGNQWVNKADEERAHAEENKAIVGGFSTNPFSLEIRGYHDSMGSEMDGLSFALSISSSIGYGGENGVKHYGLEGGFLSSNRNYVPPTGAPMEFSRSWVGITYDYRRSVYRSQRLVAGIHGRGLLALSNPWLALITIGPEIAITDRIQVSVGASADLHRFDMSNGLGWRAELGVRF